MYGSAMNQGMRALMDRERATGAQKNAYYSGKQKECQIVRILSSESDHHVNVPGLKPNFINATDASGSGSAQEIFYQVRSFSTTNRFYNTSPDMTVRLRVVGAIYDAPKDLPSNTTFPATFYCDAPGTREQGPFIDLALTNQESLMSPQQLADALQMSVLKHHVDVCNMIGGEDLSWYKNETDLSSTLFRDIFSVFKFEYDEVSGKLALVGQPNKINKSRYVVTIDDGGHSNVGYTMKAVSVEIYPTPTMNNDKIIRVAKLFGFNDLIGTGKIGLIFTSDLDFNAIGEQQVIQGHIPSSSLALYGIDLQYPHTGLYQDSVVDLTEIMTPGNQMNMLRYDRIFVRSSLMNTIWKQDGTKSDEIAVICLTGGSFDSIQQYVIPGDSSRIYEVKETTLGSSSFSIRITDQNDTLVEFVDDYELTLAFFFLPANNVVSTF